MSTVQLDGASLALPLSELAAPLPSEAPARPSFDEHLQQARRQEEPAPRLPAESNPSAAPATAPVGPSESDEELAQVQPTEVPTTGESSPETAGPEPESGDGEASAPQIDAIAAMLITCFAAPTLESHAAPQQAVGYCAVETASPTPPAKKSTPGGAHKPQVDASPIAATLASSVTDTLDAAVNAADPIQAEVVGPSAPDELAPPTVGEVAAINPLELPSAAPAKPRSRDPQETATEGATTEQHPGSDPLATLTPALTSSSPLAAATEGATTNVKNAAMSGGPTAVEGSGPVAPHPEPSSTPPPVPAEGTSPKPPQFSLPGRAANAGATPQLSEADRARFVTRVARAVETAGENGSLRLRLSPPELGSLRLEVTVRQGALSAHVEAETPQARSLLLDNLPALRERLLEQNIKIERFDVDLMNQSPGGQPNGYRREPQQADEPAKVRPGAAGTEANQEPRSRVSRRLSGGDKLNVVA